MSGSVVVTGVSSGIGAAIARHLAVRGFRVFGTVRRAADGVVIAKDGVTPVRMDVTDEASIARARDEVTQALGAAPLIGLVNNAGIPAGGPLELLPIAHIRQVLEVNLIGAVAVTQAFLPLLKYAASKFGLEAISDSWRRELIPFGVKVIVIEPGTFRSRIWNKAAAMDLSRYRGTPYEPMMERVRRHALRAAEEAPLPDRVARLVAHALTARRPPIRRVVSAHTWFNRLLLRLPDRLVDWLVARLWRRQP
ncbi:MAG: hypothetical protein DMD67_18605 [Gemmatimonadetes bacterium]|nr:MAG: hypothetical protein DMD67_18605 [Gemmatimonadota bacterium]